jgi:hypothetical protein
MAKLELLAGEKLDRETKKAIQACNDYLRMGPGRSLQKLHRIYAAPGPEKPPTRHLATLKIWSSAYGWQDRAMAYDAEVERQKNEYTEQRRREAMETALALDYERVLELKRMFSLLDQELYETDGNGNVIGFKRETVWVPDVKQIGGGKFATQVDIERFNRAIFEIRRGLLDDIAKEVGGRKQLTEMDVNLARRIEFFDVIPPEESDDGQ